jgi:hypothetical protein
MSKPTSFPDGSSIEWVDKETLRYRDSAGSALVWVDFETGMFSKGRIIRASSIKLWESPTSTGVNHIDATQKEQIIAKVKSYYASHNVPCRVEDQP